jgi:hypothetical protein
VVKKKVKVVKVKKVKIKRKRKKKVKKEKAMMTMKIVIERKEMVAQTIGIALNIVMNLMVLLID